MSDNWLAVALYTLVVIGVGVGMITLGAIFGPRRRKAAKDDPYECGAPLLSSARERFSVHFYLVAILFILFDIETVFLIPWAVTSADLHQTSGIGVLIAVFAFLGVIVFGLIYEWRRGALEWE